MATARGSGGQPGVEVTSRPTSTVVALSGQRRAAFPTTAVALIRPPSVVMPEAPAGHGPPPPIGLAYVAAALREVGHAVQLIDAPGEAMDRSVRIDSPVGELE